MKEAFAWIGACLLAIAVMAGLGWLFTGNALFLKSFFDPKFEQVRRTTFEESKAYRDGMAQELRALQIEYVKADDRIKPALASAIRHKAVGVPADALPYDLAIFIKELP